jgi:hypothetical protein
MNLRAAFESKRPNITSSERTKNLKAKSIYTSMQSLVRYGAPTFPETPVCSGAGQNYTGTIKFDPSGNVTNYRSYDLATTMAKGAAFNWDNCCKGLAAEGPTGPFNVWGPYAYKSPSLHTWNINDTQLIMPDPNTSMQYWNGTIWVVNNLNNFGIVGTQGSTLDGSGVWIDPSNNLFGSIQDCEIDKWKKFAKNDATTLVNISGNDTKHNYLVGYQPIGRRYNIRNWNLRFRPTSYNFSYIHGHHVWSSVTGATGGCCQ